MIFKTAYDTLACHGFNMQETINKLKEAKVNGNLAIVSNKFRTIYTVEGFRGDSLIVPAFAHPLLFDEENSFPEIACDMRAFGHYDRITDKFIIRNEVDYRFALARTQLSLIWAEEGYSLLRNVGDFPMAIYARWISERLARAYNLDPKEQLQLCILAAIFYYSLFQDKLEINKGNDEIKLIKKISMAFSECNSNDVSNVLQQVNKNSPHRKDGTADTDIMGIEHFCELAKTVVGIRFENLNAGVLFGLLKSSWFGAANSLEIVCSALEHPPTWLAMLGAAISERTFKKSGIAMVVDRYNRGGVDEQFVRSLLRLIEQSSH